MKRTEQEANSNIILERTILIPPTSQISEIPIDEASQGFTIDALRALAEPSFKQRMQKVLGFQSLKLRLK